MRLIHTSDWHLGRTLFGTSLLEDQAHVLEQLLENVRDFRPDVVVIVGDLFERATPGPEAVELLDRTLSRLIQDAKVKVVLLPGQQDSATRLAFCSWLLDKRGLYLITNLEQALSPLVFEDADGPVHVHAIPYLDPAAIGRHFRGEPATGHSAAISELLNHLTRFRRLRRKSVRGVVAGYLQLAGGVPAGSERPLAAPGEPGVDPESFAGISYGALGYYHQPQQFGNLCYSGAPLPFSFAEAETPRSLNRVEIDREGQSVVESVLLKPKRFLHRLEGSLELLLEGPGPEVRAGDYVMLVLDDASAPSAEQMDRLRRLYPNLLSLERPALDAAEAPGALPEGPLLDLYASFFRKATGQDLEDEARRTLQDLLQEEAMVMVPPTGAAGGFKEPPQRAGEHEA